MTFTTDTGSEWEFDPVRKRIRRVHVGPGFYGHAVRVTDEWRSYTELRTVPDNDQPLRVSDTKIVEGPVEGEKLLIVWGHDPHPQGMMLRTTLTSKIVSLAGQN